MQIVVLQVVLVRSTCGTQKHLLNDGIAVILLAFFEHLLHWSYSESLTWGSLLLRV